MIGQVIGDAFEIVKELGNGAMGTVYLAKYVKTGKLVAVKLISYGLISNETAMERFRREGAILKSLRHPNIVRWYATGPHKLPDGKRIPFFAMEYVQGDSLDHVLERRGRIAWQEVVTLGIQLCDALQHAHEKAIVHRDLKPSNLMILADGTLKLTDFGIAKDPNVTALTGTNSTIGTAAYMSPEQCKGDKSLSGKSDLYSMGVVFYEMLAGRKPFLAETSVEMFMHHVKSKVERPSRLVPDIPMWLDTLVTQLLEKKPEHRPLDAATTRQALEEVIQKVEASRPIGVDIANARVMDKGKIGGDLDETEREAARTLRAGTRKRKKKSTSVALHQQAWVKAALILAGIAGLVGLAWLALRPESPEAMIAAVDSRVKKVGTDVASHDSALEAITKYLAVYGERGDPETERIRAEQARLRVNMREIQIHNRHDRNMSAEEGDDAKAYEQTMSALNAEEEGNLTAASKLWESLAKEHPSDLWGGLAKKKLGLLRAVELADRRIDQRLQQLTNSGTSLEFESDLDREMVAAIRLEAFEDGRRAMRLWNRIKDKTKKDIQARVPFLMAVKHLRELEVRYPGSETEEDVIKRRETVRELVRETIPQWRQSDDPRLQRQAFAVAEFVRDAYNDDPDPEVAGLAKTADIIVNDMMASKG